MSATKRDSDALSGHLGAAFNGQKDNWRWSLTGGYDISRNVTLTDREDAVLLTARQDRARSVNQAGNADFVANGPLAELPAGPANLTVRLGVDSWVVAKERMPELDLFRVYPSGWFVSRRLKQRIDDEGYSGMKFVPVE